MHNVWIARFAGRGIADARGCWAACLFINGDRWVVLMGFVVLLFCCFVVLLVAVSPVGRLLVPFSLD